MSATPVDHPLPPGAEPREGVGLRGGASGAPTATPTSRSSAASRAAWRRTSAFPVLWVRAAFVLMTALRRLRHRRVRRPLDGAAVRLALRAVRARSRERDPHRQAAGPGTPAHRRRARDRARLPRLRPGDRRRVAARRRGDLLAAGHRRRGHRAAVAPGRRGAARALGRLDRSHRPGQGGLRSRRLGVVRPRGRRVRPHRHRARGVLRCAAARSAPPATSRSPACSASPASPSSSGRGSTGWPPT